jgi:hypothetical protein
LRWDAGYCGGGGAIALALAVPLGRLFDVPIVLVAAIGAGTTVWACALAVLARRPDWTRSVVVVGAANAVAAAGVAILAGVAPATAPRLLLAAVSAEVAAFAVVQLRLLRR